MCDGEGNISSIDKIVVIACALCNHCDSVVPLDKLYVRLFQE